MLLAMPMKMYHSHDDVHDNITSRDLTYHSQLMVTATNKIPKGDGEELMKLRKCTKQN